MKTLIKYILPAILIMACNSEQQETNLTEPIETEAEIPEITDQTPLIQNIETYGVIIVPPTALTEFYAKTEGYISNLNFQEGAILQKGQTIAQIESPVFSEWKKEFKQAKQNFDWQKSIHDRTKKLYEGNAVSIKEYENAQNDLSQTSSQYFELRNQLLSVGFSEKQLLSDENLILYLKAPNNGTLVHIGVANGSRVNAETHLFTIVDKSNMQIEMKVNASDINLLKISQPLFIINHADTLSGKITMINAMMDNDNTVKVFGKFDNNKKTENLIIGQQFFVQIERE